MPRPTPPLAVAADVPWAPAPNRVTVHAGRAVPEPFTSAFCLVTRTGPDGPELLVVDVTSRGPDAPGGRREPGETLRQLLVRELDEEAGLQLPAGCTPAVVGHVHLRVAGPVPAGYRYPHPDSYMIATHLELPAGVEPAGTRVPEEIGGHRWIALPAAATLLAGRVWAPLLDQLPG